MRSFTDQLMLRYLNHERVASLLAPLDDPDRNRVRSLLDAVYEPGTVEVRFVDSVEIAETSFQVPVSAPITVRGNWEKLPPDMAQARAVLEVPAVTPPDWIDMSVDAVVTARVALTSGALETLAHEDVSALSEDAFGAADSATLQAQFPQLYRVHYAEPPPLTRLARAAPTVCASRCCSSPSWTSVPRCAGSSCAGGRWTRPTLGPTSTTVERCWPPARGLRCFPPPRSRPTQPRGPRSRSRPYWPPRASWPHSRKSHETSRRNQ